MHVNGKQLGSKKRDKLGTQSAPVLSRKHLVLTTTFCEDIQAQTQQRKHNWPRCTTAGLREGGLPNHPVGSGGSVTEGATRHDEAGPGAHACGEDTHAAPGRALQTTGLNNNKCGDQNKT